MRVRDAMSRTVVTVTPETDLVAAGRLMVEHGISGVPVVEEDGSVVGVLSEADFVVKTRGLEGIRHRPLSWLLGDRPGAETELSKVLSGRVYTAMSSPPVVVTGSEDLHAAAALMIERGINRLPVVEEGRLVGIVTRADIMHAWLRSDGELLAAIRERILRDELGLDPGALEVAVHDGVARIAGRVEQRSTAELVERRIAREEGVVAVESALEWVRDDTLATAAERDLAAPYR